jgi:hypothetical protein
VKVL